MSFKDDLGKAGKWFRKNIIGGKCIYCNILTTGRLYSNPALSLSNNPHFCNFPECHEKHWSEKEVKADEEAKKKAEEAQKEAMEKRESEIEGMVNAGIPRQLVDMWVSGELEKSDMFLMLKTFDEDLSKWVEQLIIIIRKSEIPRYFTGDIKENITMLKSLISDYPEDMVIHTFQNHSLFDKQALEFVQKCQTEDHLYPLYLEILERDFDIEFAYKLVNDFGFNEHPEALKEVVDGANWEAVAVKHGFLQF